VAVNDSEPPQITNLGPTAMDKAVICGGLKYVTATDIVGPYP